MRRLPLLLSFALLAGCEGDPATTFTELPDAEAEVKDSDAEPDAEPDADDPDVPLPEPLTWPVGEAGPYRVGYRTMQVTYDPAGAPAPRTVKLHLWYPTLDETGEGARYLGLFPDDDSFVDASLAPPEAGYGDRYPVHVHSHGHMGFAGSSASLMRHFATHGWVVAAPDHTGNTLADALNPRPTWMYFVRGLDISASLDHLAALPADGDAADPLAGQLALDAVVMSGHSYGGYTTFAVAGAAFDMARLQADCAAGQGPGGAPCSDDELAVFAAGTRDPRVVAAIPMAAGNRAMFGDAGYAAVQAPILMMTGAADDSVKNLGEGDPTWAALTGPALRVDIAGGCHQVFALGGCDAISDAEGFGIVNHYALGFARRHVLGDPTVDALLSGDVQVSPAVSFSAKP